MRILIAEDDLTSRLVLEATLKKQGHEVVVTTDGREAWEALQAPDAPKLAILDWMMPELDGIEVCREIRAHDKTRLTYVILLTALTAKKNLVEGLAAGADDYLSKPVDDDVLRARIGVAERVIALQALLALQASTDTLTGLPNRRAGLAALSGELDRASREGNEVAIGIIDIDHFKAINDTYGHLVGDDVLREFGDRLRSAVRSYDHVARIGGEEFLLVMPGGDPSAPNRWERVQRLTTTHPFETRAGMLRLTVSIGYSWGDGTSAEETLMAAADRALYVAKESGRNQVVCDEVRTGPLPRAFAPEPEQEESGACLVPAGPTVRRVLVVSSALTSRMIMIAMAEKLGFETLGASTCREGLDILLRANRLACVVLLDGAHDSSEVDHFVTRLRQMEPAPYVIGMFDADELAVAEDLAVARFDDLIAKPVRKHLLNARLSAAFATKHAEAERGAHAVIQERLRRERDEARALLPVCPHCGRLRDSEAYLDEVRAYVSAHHAQLHAWGCASCTGEHPFKDL